MIFGEDRCDFARYLLWELLKIVRFWRFLGVYMAIEWGYPPKRGRNWIPRGGVIFIVKPFKKWPKIIKNNGFTVKMVPRGSILNGFTVKMTPKTGGLGPPKTNSNRVFQENPPLLGGGLTPIFDIWGGLGSFLTKITCVTTEMTKFGHNTCIFEKMNGFWLKKPKMGHKKTFFSNLNVFWIEF